MSRAYSWFCAVLVTFALLTGCGKKDEDATESAAAEASADTAGSDDEMDPFERAMAEREKKRAERNAAREAEKEAEKLNPKPDPTLAAIERLAAKGDENSLRQADMMRAQYDYNKVISDPKSTPEQKKASLDKMVIASKLAFRRDNNVKQPVLDLPPDWAATHREQKNAKEAELLVQVGDIDNLGFGWPEKFDPFAGKSTPIHRFPWAPEADDPPGTDRIMVNTGAQVMVRRQDGYTRETYRPENLPQPLTIEFDPAGVVVKGAVLQLFVDDFQAPAMHTRFSVTLDGQPAPDVETTINKLNQTGPIGKLITIKLLPEYLGLLADGKLSVLIDDTTTNVGDGFAFDFARLLINPKGFAYSGTIRGIVVDKETEKPLDGALASAGNVRQATTGADGKFELKEVPAGLVVVTGSHPDYVTGSEQNDLEAGDELDITIRLERTKDDLAERLEEDGKVDLYGIYFDTDKAVLKPESEGTLQQVLSLLKDAPDLRIAIAGHTDSQSTDTYNLDLSKRRALAVVKWLTDKGIAASRLEAQGFGESQPVADNDSAAGRALNRRVEIRDLTR
jgi:outer membrane protein OmpA-like peptidoglycan-associated protein